MPDWPNDVVSLAPFGTLSTLDDSNPVTAAAIANGQSFAATSWQSAGTALYVPTLVRTPVTVYQMAWWNGSTLGSNVDVGIYDGNSKARLVSTGSTAQAGTSVLQAVDVADTLIPAGLHYLAMGVDTTTGFINQVPFQVAAFGRACGLAQGLTFPLPVNAVFGALALLTQLPVIVAAIQGSVF